MRRRQDGEGCDVTVQTAASPGPGVMRQADFGGAQVSGGSETFGERQLVQD